MRDEKKILDIGSWSRIIEHHCCLGCLYIYVHRYAKNSINIFFLYKGALN